MDQEKLKTLATMIDQAKNIVFFGGAGVSTESGIPDFRSAGGIFSQGLGYTVPVEEIVSRDFFFDHTEEFYRFYKDKMIFADARPNPAHKALAKLEEMGKLKAVITQNIDGLHQLAGSKRVFELHGSVHRNFCLRCGRKYPGLDILQGEGIPRCPECGGIVRPDVVLYQESLDSDVLRGSVDAIRQADMMIVGGTSLVVYPAAGLINYFNGKYLVLINKSSTHMDSRADLRIDDGIGAVFAELFPDCR